MSKDYIQCGKCGADKNTLNETCSYCGATPLDNEVKENEGITLNIKGIRCSQCGKEFMSNRDVEIHRCPHVVGIRGG